VFLAWLNAELWWLCWSSSAEVLLGKVGRQGVEYTIDFCRLSVELLQLLLAWSAWLRREILVAPQRSNWFRSSARCHGRDAKKKRMERKKESCFLFARHDP